MTHTGMCGGWKKRLKGRMEYTQSSRNKHIGANALCLALLRHVDGTYACIYMRAILNFRGRFDSPASGEKSTQKSTQKSNSIEKYRGGIFNPKIYIAEFGPSNRAFSA